MFFSLHFQSWAVTSACPASCSPGTPHSEWGMLFTSWRTGARTLPTASSSQVCSWLERMREKKVYFIGNRSQTLSSFWCTLSAGFCNLWGNLVLCTQSTMMVILETVHFEQHWSKIYVLWWRSGGEQNMSAEYMLTPILTGACVVVIFGVYIYI